MTVHTIQAGQSSDTITRLFVTTCIASTHQRTKPRCAESAFAQVQQESCRAVGLPEPSSPSCPSERLSLILPEVTIHVERALFIADKILPAPAHTLHHLLDISRSTACVQERQCRPLSARTARSRHLLHHKDLSIGC